MSAPRRGRRGGRRRAAASNTNTTGEANTGDNMNMAGNENMGMTTGTRGRRGRRRGRRRGAATTAAASAGMGANANVSGGEQTDLSGTYTGTINCLGNTGDATLTVNGQQFTLSGASTASGRIVAETTRGYTGATLRFDAAGGGTPQTVSVRARKMGDRLSLSPVPGETNQCSFTPAGAGGGTRGRRGRRRGAAMTPAAPAAGEATTGAEATGTTGTTGTGRRRRGRRRGATSTAAPANLGGDANANLTAAPTNDNTNANTGTGRRRGGRRRGASNSNMGANSNSTTPPQ
jgi:hypothetical protein